MLCLVRLPPLFQTIHNEVTGLMRCPDEDTQQARGHVQDPVRYQFLLGLGVVIQGAGSLGRAGLPVPGEVPHIHFGLGIHGNPHDIGGVVRRLILLTDILENRIGFGNLLQRFGLLHPPQLIPQTVEDHADRVHVGKFLVRPAFLVDEGLPHPLGRDSSVQKRRLKLWVRLAFGIRQSPDVGF